MRTFGSFSLSWKGKRIDAFFRKSNAQSIVLLQLLLHRRREGVSREQLIEALFYDREPTDLSHALHVRIYNLKSKLRKVGLPPCNYIENREGAFFWTEQIPVEEDADIFEAACRQAEAETDAKTRLELLLGACRLYSGEFLYPHSDQLWANHEGRRYEVMFDHCVKEAAGLLHRARDWHRLMLLGGQATQAQPFCGWEALTMEAMISLGRNEDAMEVFRQAEVRYRTEMGLSPDEEMVVLAEQARAHLGLAPEDADLIRRDLLEGAPAEGGLLCPYPVFKNMCRMAQRLSPWGERFLLLRISLPEGNEESMAQLQRIVCSVLQEGDAAAPCGDRQLLVLLADGAARENVVSRIQAELAEKRNELRAEVSFLNG